MEESNNHGWVKDDATGLSHYYILEPGYLAVTGLCGLVPILPTRVKRHAVTRGLVEGDACGRCTIFFNKESKKFSDG